MPFALVSNTKGKSAVNADTFTTPGIDTTGANLLVMCVASDHATMTPSDSNANTWVLARSETAFNYTAIWFAWQAVTVGAGHTFSLTGTDIYGSIQVYAFSGADVSASPVEDVNSNVGFGTTTIQPGAVAPSTDGQLIVTILHNNTSGIPTIGSSFTSPAGAGTGYGDAQGDFGFRGSFSAYLIQPTGASVNPTWTSASANLWAAIATFEAGAGGGGGGFQAAWARRSTVTMRAGRLMP